MHRAAMGIRLVSGALAMTLVVGCQSDRVTLPPAASTAPVPSQTTPSTHSPASTPDLVVAAPVRVRIPIPNPGVQAPFPEELAVAGGAIWIEKAGRPIRLLRVDTRTERITTIVELDQAVKLLTGDDGSLWAAGPWGYTPGPTSFTLSRVDLATGRLAKVAGVPSDWIAAGLGSIWVSTDTHFLRLDRTTGRTLETRNVAIGEPQVACGALWGSTGELGVDAVLTRFDPISGTIAHFDGVGGPIYERADGCWRWVSNGIERMGSSPLLTKTTVRATDLQFAGGDFWQSPPIELQRWDPVTGSDVETRWLVDDQDLVVTSKNGLDATLLAAAGSLWLVNAYEVVRFEIPTNT